MSAALIQLDSPHYVLRALDRTSPTDAFQRWAQNPEMMTPLNLPARVLTAQQISDYWGSFDNDTRFFFGIFERASGRALGFWMIETNPLHALATLHLAVEPGPQAIGATSGSAVALFDWLFDARGYEKLVTLTLPTNEKIMRLMVHAGFTREATLRKEIKSLNGVGRLDQVRFGLLAEEWRAIRADRAPSFFERFAARGSVRSPAPKTPPLRILSFA